MMVYFLLNFLIVLGDLHLLLKLIDQWDKYEDKVNEFFEDHPAGLTLATTKKLYTLARSLSLPERQLSIVVLRDWYKNGDGSRFSRGHLEFPEIKELKDEDCATILKQYCGSPHTFVFIFNHADNTRKPELQHSARIL